MSAIAEVDTFGQLESEDTNVVTRLPLDLQSPVDIVTYLMRAQMSGELVETYVAMLADSQCPRVYEAVLSEMRQYTEGFRVIAAAIIADLRIRMKDRKASAIPDPEFEIALEPVYTEYTRNVDKAIEAAFLLPEEEANKVVTFVPRFVHEVDAHHEVGNPNSINALKRRYAGSEVAKLLEQALHHTKIDEKVVLRRRKGAIAEVAG